MKILILGCVSLMFFLVVFSGQVYAKIDSSTTAGIWLFDEGKDDVAADLSVNRNKGEVLGAQWVIGYFGKALEFDGVDSYVDCGNAECLAITDSITIMAWIKPKTLGDYEAVVEKFDWVSDKGGYVLRMMATGQVSLRLVLSDDNAFTFVSNGGVTTDEWHHIAGTYDGKSAEIWIDGVLDKEGDASGTIVVTQDNLKIGWDNHDPIRRFDGIIDDVAVFNVALTGDEIKSIMTQGLSAVSAISPAGKTTATWGSIKCQNNLPG